ncbi:hypothetical protein AX15_005285 [Amanita polypyramis BW_CC]|nr:hypothetical protein AX15_005285 [Amanita polypyramis BW_CC]
MHQSNSYIDPTALSSPSESEPGPSRKRARADLSTEERKEARAHRNRIAAQNSRDRRKAQFSHLERRVAELEEENRQLRAGMGLTPNVSLATPARLAEEEKERQRQCAQERENEELKERIRTLEKGWDAVIKALAAQGFPSLVAQPPAPLSTATVSPSESSTRTSSPAESISSITSPAPPFKPESSPLPDTTFPLSPAPSYTSLNFDSSPSPMFSTAPELPPSPSLRNIKNESVLEHDSTRHLARMATNEDSSLALQRVVSPRSRSLSVLTSLVRRLNPTRAQVLSMSLAARSMRQPWSACSVKSLRPHRLSKRTICLLWTRPSPKRQVRRQHPSRRK